MPSLNKGNPLARYEAHVDKNFAQPYIAIEDNQIITTDQRNRMGINQAREYAYWAQQAGYNVSISYAGDADPKESSEWAKDIQNW